MIRKLHNRLAGFALLAMGLEGSAAAAQVRPHPAVEQIVVEERIGAGVPMDLKFVDPSGRMTALGDHLERDRPVVLVLAYYRCRMLCGLMLPGLARTAGVLDQRLGRDYRIVTLSIDPDERPIDAGRKARAILPQIGRSVPSDGWIFLVGGEAAIRRLAEAIGFRYAYDRASDQFAHPAVAVVLTPEGTISSYLHGVDPSPSTLARALSDARQGRTMSSLRSVLLRCFRSSPALRRYGEEIFGFLRGGAMMILAGVVITLGVLWHRERRGAR